MNSQNLKGKVVSGLFWRFAERVIVQAISFIISLILARMLTPQLYGTVALVLVFINLANVLVNSGLGEACVQDKNAGQLEFSTMFYCSLAFSATLYLLLFILAEPIAMFYNDSSLCIVIRVLSIQIPLSSIKTIQQAYVSKHMMFKKFFFSTLGGTVSSGIVGIAMAYAGFGVWALVAQHLINSAIDMLVLFITVPWRPQKLFNVSVAKKLCGYGWKLMASSFLSELYTELRSLIIGKKYSSADLAYYNKGNQFPSLAITSINASISSVLFPAMSSVSDSVKRLKEVTSQSMKIASYIIFPIMVGLFGIAEPLIRFLLTDKWINCVPYLRLCCIYWMIQPIQTANIQAIKAAGRSDICLKLEIIKKIIGLALLFGSMHFGVFAVVFSNVIFATISMLINIMPNKKLIKYGYKEQFKDILPSLFISVLMLIAVMQVGKLAIPDLMLLILQIIVGVIVYLVLSILTKNTSYIYVVNILKDMTKKREV